MGGMQTSTCNLVFCTAVAPAWGLYHMGGGTKAQGGRCICKKGNDGPLPFLSVSHQSQGDVSKQFALVMTLIKKNNKIEITHQPYLIITVHTYSSYRGRTAEAHSWAPQCRCHSKSTYTWYHVWPYPKIRRSDRRPSSPALGTGLRSYNKGLKGQTSVKGPLKAPWRKCCSCEATGRVQAMFASATHRWRRISSGHAPVQSRCSSSCILPRAVWWRFGSLHRSGHPQYTDLNEEWMDHCFHTCTAFNVQVCRLTFDLWQRSDYTTHDLWPHHSEFSGTAL